MSCLPAAQAGSWRAVRAGLTGAQTGGVQTGANLADVWVSPSCVEGTEVSILGARNGPRRHDPWAFCPWHCV